MCKVEIWHNPRCSKSRATYELLQEKGVDIEVVEYLKTENSVEDIKNLLGMLDMKAKDLMRTKEDIFKELNLKEIEDEDLLIRAMVAHPKLIERPIVIKDAKAVIGRPIENVIELIG
ncbi:MAG TPA: arsenate reductase (glutaredoxin) [Campylobacterales bacterium]|nr:arsenate reductase (glutaredoxin) [Campylobacterales bacterium]